VVDQVKTALDSFSGDLKKSTNDPDNLMKLKNDGGCVAGIIKKLGASYGKKVSQKLQGVHKEADSLTVTFGSLSGEARDLLDKLSSTLASILPTVSGKLNELQGLPHEFQMIAEKVMSASGDEKVHTVANVDMGPIDRSLDVSSINAPLDQFVSLKAELTPLIESVKAAVQKLASFLAKAPSQIQHAFDVCPCVPAASVSPVAMTDLLDKLKVFQQFDLKPLIDLLTQTSKSVKGFDVEHVRSSMTNFSNFAKDETKQLTDAIAEAKTAASALEMANKAKNEGASLLSRLW
jgi:uncharacterized protein YoxC